MPRTNKAVLALINLKAKNAIRQGGANIEQVAEHFLHLPNYLRLRIDGDTAVLTVDPTRISKHPKLLQQAGVDTTKLDNYGFKRDDAASDQVHTWSLQLTKVEIINALSKTIEDMDKKGAKVMFTSDELWNKVSVYTKPMAETTTQWIISRGGALSITYHEPGVDEIGFEIDLVPYRVNHQDGLLTQIEHIATIFMAVTRDRIGTMSLMHQTDTGVEVSDLSYTFDGEQVTLDVKADVSPMTMVGHELPNFVTDTIDGIGLSKELKMFVTSLTDDSDGGVITDDGAMRTIPANVTADGKVQPTGHDMP